MLTPQEVKDKKFEKAVFGGYEVNAIDEFLDAVTEDYTALFKENATLKSKLKVLVDKIEEYRSVDDEMRKALLVAQKTASEYMNNAKKESENFLNQAKSEAEHRLSAIRREIETEERRLLDSKKMSAGFINDMIARYQEAEAGLSRLFTDFGASDVQDNAAQDEECAEPEESLPPAEEEPEISKSEEETVSAAVPVPAGISPAEEINHNGMKVQVYELNLDRHDRHEGKSPKSDSATVADDFDTGTFFTPKPKFDFNNLKFGKDYDGEDI